MSFIPVAAIAADKIFPMVKELLSGLGVSAAIFFLTLLFALPLGLLIACGRMSKKCLISGFFRLFISVMRGTPLMLQLFIWYFSPFYLFNIPLSELAFCGIEYRYTAVIIGFALNYAAYFSEIYRGGIESISKGQYEAGQVLGMTKTQIFFKVVLMQVVKRILAPMSNEVITLVKDTALARVIMIVEIIQAAQNFAAYGLMWPLFYTAVFYLIFVGVLSLLFGYFEKKLDYYRV